MVLVSQNIRSNRLPNNGKELSTGQIEEIFHLWCIYELSHFRNLQIFQSCHLVRRKKENYRRFLLDWCVVLVFMSVDAIRAAQTKSNACKLTVSSIFCSLNYVHDQRRMKFGIKRCQNPVFFASIHIYVIRVDAYVDSLIHPIVRMKFCVGMKLFVVVAVTSWTNWFVHTNDLFPLQRIDSNRTEHNTSMEDKDKGVIIT